jgi:predicted GNAT family acetyltransferase
MQETLRTRCVCGWETTGREDEVVAATLDHGLRVHNMGGTREDVLERAERIDPTGADPATLDRLQVVDVPERRRFDALLGTRVIGFSQYMQRDGTIELLHTEIDPDFEGKGFGAQLATAVLADVIGRGTRVIVRCPFISAYVRRHRADYPGVEVDGDRKAAS